jgi:predicted kinase
MSMDLRFRWEDELAERFEDAYFAGLPEPDEARALLPFYVAYRAAVRGKVHGIRATEDEIPSEDRQRAKAESAAHWLFGWSTLAPPAERPAIVGVFGLPGTGKSTLAREIADRYDFEVIDSDIVRKELAGLDPKTSARGALDEGIYTAEFSRKTYAECISRAEEVARRGGRAIVDATFRSERWRVELMNTARAAGVTGLMIECALPRDVARSRIDARSTGPSDADWAVYEHIEAGWDALSDDVAPRVRRVQTVARQEAKQAAREVLVEFGLASR